MELSFRTREYIYLWILSLVVCGFLASCRNHTKDEIRNRTQDSLLRKTDDSVRMQSPRVYSMIEKGMRTATDSITYYEYYLRKSNMCFLNSKADSINYYADHTLEFARRQNPRTPRVYELIGLAYTIKAAYYYRYKSNTDSVLYYYAIVYKYMMKSCDLEKLPNICGNIADAYAQKNDIPQAAHWYRRALFLADSLHMPYSTNVSLNMGLAQIYMILRDYKTAEEYYEHTHTYYNELDPNLQIYFLNNYGNFLYYKKDYRKALVIFKRMKALLERQNPQKKVFDYYLCLLNTADVYLKLGMADSSKACIGRCEPYFQKNKVDVAIYYVNTVKIGIALATDRVEDARKIISTEKVAPPNEPNIVNIRSEYLKEFYVETGNYKNAFYTLSDYMNRNDSLEHNKIHMRAAEIMMRFQQDTLTLHNQLNIKEKEKEVRTAYTWIILIVSISIILALSLLIIITNGRKKKAQNQMKMLQLRLSSVRNRISPHFIFNVLNHEINKNEKIDPEELMSLTQFLRTGLDISRNTYVTLKDELDFVSKYINTTRHLLGADFRFNINAPSDDITKEYTIPSMFIQILAENAVKHGLMGKEGTKELDIIAKCSKNEIEIIVRDNGTGFNISKSSSNSTKTGLNILRQSIFIINERSKHKMSFSIHNRQTEDGKIKGCEAILHIPTRLRLE